MNVNGPLIYSLWTNLNPKKKPQADPPPWQSPMIKFQNKDLFIYNCILFQNMTDNYVLETNHSLWVE